MSPSTGTADRPAVLAAGCLCWRLRGGHLQVLLIHRPRYDDWSWPKGKTDPGETAPETAVREVHEEVGLRVRLGLPLPPVQYPVSGNGTKRVEYWAAEVETGAKVSVDGKEVDEHRWVSVKEARAMLTNKRDREPLDALADHAEADRLATVPLIVVRHGKAKPRSSWARAEGDRPLAATGKRQVLAVTRLLRCWSPEKIDSSPWLRCLSTVTPYAKKYGVPIKTRNPLTEAGHRHHPEKVVRLVDRWVEKAVPRAACTHRPVLPTVLKALRRHMGEALARQLPDRDPYLAPGQMLVLHLARRGRHRVVALEVVSPFDD